MFSFSRFASFRFLGTLEITGHINPLSKVQIFLRCLDDSIVNYTLCEWLTPFSLTLTARMWSFRFHTKEFYQSQT